MANNVLELRIESTLDSAGIDAAKQGVSELTGATSAASGAMGSTASSASTALQKTGQEATKTAQEVTRVGDAAGKAAQKVNAMGAAAASTAAASAKMGTAATSINAVTASAKGAGAAVAGIGTAAAGAQESAVTGLNVMSLGANLLTGNIMGTIRATTELATHFKGISMIKFSGIALAIAGVATAWQFVTKKIKEFNSEIGKARVDALAHQMDQLKVRYDEVTKSIERFSAAQAQSRSNSDRFSELAFGRARQNLAETTEKGLGGSMSDAEREAVQERHSTRSAAIDNAERLYKAKMEVARATKEAEKVEASYNATARANNSQIRALNNLYSELNQTQKQAKTGSMGQKAEAEAAIPGLEAQIEKTKQAVAEGRARAETLRLAMQQAPVEAQIAEQKLKAVEAEVKLSTAVTARQKLEDYQRQRDAERVTLASAVADAEAEVTASRERLARSEDNAKLKERTKELQKQASKMQDQVNKAKQLIGLLDKAPDREKALAKSDKEAARQAKEEEKRRQKEQRTAEDIARHANGQLSIDIESGDYKVVGMDGSERKLSKKDAARLERLNRIRKAEEALDPDGQQAGIRNALRQQMEDAANNFGQDEANAKKDVDASEEAIEDAKDALQAFDEATQTGLLAVQEEVAAWKEGTADAIAQATQLSKHAVDELARQTKSHNDTLTKLLTSI